MKKRPVLLIVLLLIGFISLSAFAGIFYVCANEDTDSDIELYSRKVDPVAQQYLLNLLSTYLDTPSNRQRIDNILKTMPIYVRKATASSESYGYEARKARDGAFYTRWSSDFSDPQWITFDLSCNKDFNRIVLYWEVAYGSSYQIQISDDNIYWTDIYFTTDGDGGIDEIPFDMKNARYIRMYGTERGTEWGYSLWEFEVYHDEVPLGSISGSVTLEGRINHSSFVTFELREPGQTTPIANYQPTNDEDPSTPGTQITTSSIGSYTLINIPPGTYDLTSKPPNSLRAKETNISVFEGQETSNIDFYLLGGDANGDNSVATGDMVILSAAWLGNPQSPNWDERADFNGDGSIGTGDMVIMRSNWLVTGEE